MDNSYRLEPFVHAAVYKEEIEPAYFLATSPVEKPRITIVAGQPGAGKTKVLELSTRLPY